jgi:hypothetical protein
MGSSQAGELVAVAPAGDMRSEWGERAGATWDPRNALPQWLLDIPTWKAPSLPGGGALCVSLQASRRGGCAHRAWGLL